MSARTKMDIKRGENQFMSYAFGAGAKSSFMSEHYEELNSSTHNFMSFSDIGSRASMCFVVKRITKCVEMSDKKPQESPICVSKEVTMRAAQAECAHHFGLRH